MSVSNQAAGRQAEVAESCPLCGAAVAGGACRRLFEEVLTFEYGSPGFGAVHQLTVDAYALQHCEEHRPRSNAFHLARLCMFLEHGADAGIGRQYRWLQVRLENDRAVPYLEPPADRGTVTIAEVHGAKTTQEHAERTRRWATSVWKAWSDYHEWARQWLQGSRNRS